MDNLMDEINRQYGRNIMKYVYKYLSNYKYSTVWEVMDMLDKKYNFGEEMDG